MNKPLKSPAKTKTADDLFGASEPKGKAALTFIVTSLGEDDRPVTRPVSSVAANAIPLTEEPVFIEGI